MTDTLPLAIDGCRCICHRKPGVRHFLVCCGPGSVKIKAAVLPTEPGYYWAKLKTPSGGTLYNKALPGGVYLDCEDEDWSSFDWEIVQVNDNNGEGDEKFSVDVFGIPISQWPLDFFWGPKIELEKPQ